LIDVRISPELVKENERMLTGGFYAEVTLGYDASIAQEKGGRPFGVESLRAIQLSKREVLDVLGQGARANFTTAEWRRPAAAQRGLRARH
jgi:ATP-dependent Lon protease